MKLGEPQWIEFQADKKIVMRRMQPVLDENGGWLRWLPAVCCNVPWTASCQHVEGE